MKILLILNGKTEADWLIKGIQEYEKRLNRYIKFDSVVIPALKNTSKLSETQQLESEYQLIKKHLSPDDHLVLLDEKGTEYRSVEFAQYLQKKMNSGIKKLVFIVGGPYGFANELKQKSNHQLSFSPMTFTHQMIRLLFVEQLYRAFTILKNEPYHHES